MYLQYCREHFDKYDAGASIFCQKYNPERFTLYTWKMCYLFKMYWECFFCAPSPTLPFIFFIKGPLWHFFKKNSPNTKVEGIDKYLGTKYSIKNIHQHFLWIFNLVVHGDGGARYWYTLENYGFQWRGMRFLPLVRGEGSNGGVNLIGGGILLLVGRAF